MLGFLRDYLIYVWNVLFGKSQPVSGSLTSPSNLSTTDHQIQEQKEESKQVPVPSSKESIIISESTTSPAPFTPNYQSEQKPKEDPAPLRPASADTKQAPEVKPVSPAAEPKLPSFTPLKSESEKQAPLLSESKQLVPSAAFSKEPIPSVENKSIPSNTEVKVKTQVESPLKSVDLSYGSPVKEKDPENEYEYEEEEDDIEDEDLDEKIKNYLRAIQEQEHREQLEKQNQKSKLDLKVSDPKATEQEFIEDITPIDDDDIEDTEEENLVKINK